MKPRGKRLGAVNSQNDSPFPAQIAAFYFDRVPVTLVIIGRNGSRWEQVPSWESQDCDTLALFLSIDNFTSLSLLGSVGFI